MSVTLCVCVCVWWGKRGGGVKGQDLHAFCCPLVQDTAMKMSDCPKKRSSMTCTFRVHPV